MPLPNLRRSPSPRAGASRRDRHGRGPRGPLAWPPVPVMSSRRAAFDELVTDTASRLQHHVAPYGSVEFAVEDVPAVGHRAGEPAPLGRLYPGTRHTAPRIVVYRRPIELRASDARDLPDLVHHVLLEQVAVLLGVRPDELDPDADEDH